MKWKPTAALVAVFAIFLAYVLIFQRGEPPREMQVVRFDKAKAAKIEVTYPGLTPARQPLVLEKRDDDWYIAQPLQALADKDAVEGMLDRLSKLEATAQVPGEDASKLLKEKASEIGLDKPETIIKVLDGKGRALVELQVGKKQPAGYDLYALANKQLITLSSYTVDDFKKQPADLRDKHLFHAKEETDIQAVTLDYGTRRLAIARAGENDWKLTEPVQAPGSWACGDVARKVKDLQIKDFVEKPSQNLAEYGLDKPRIKVTMQPKEGEPQTVLIGKKKADAAGDVAYAKAEGRSDIVLIAEQDVTDLTKEPTDLRDTQLVTDVSASDAKKLTITQGGTQIVLERRDKEWQMVLPQAGPADKQKVDDIAWDVSLLDAVKFVEEKPSDLKRYGLDQPQAEIEVQYKEATVTVAVGTKGEQPDTAYARVDGKGPVVLVRDDLLKTLPKDPKTLLAKPPETETKPTP